jgi:hypothetical protein
MSDYNTITEPLQAIEAPHPLYHEQGYWQTATGYGGKLITRYKVEWNGRIRRVYCMCWSNVGTLYILCKGERWIIPDYLLIVD